MEMLLPKKNQANCSAIMTTISESSIRSHITVNMSRSPVIPIQGMMTCSLVGQPSFGLFPSEPKTPMHGSMTGSPETDYFRVPGPRHASRWKEDWEELELLVSPAGFCEDTDVLTRSLG